MRQTVKYARVRASQDPDRTAEKGGTYFGNNLPGTFRIGMERWSRAALSWSTRYGATIRSCDPVEEMRRVELVAALQEREEKREASELKRLRETLCGTVEAYRRAGFNV